MRAIVTGAAGFVGAHLVRRLATLGWDVRALVRPTTDTWRLTGASPSLRIVHGDLADFGSGSLDAAMMGAEVIFHLAAEGVDPSRQDPGRIVESNVVGTMRTMQAAERLSVERVVYCGSCFEYGEATRANEDQPLAPPTEYAASKSAGAAMARQYGERAGIDIVTVRPFTIYGPMEAPYRLVPQTILAALDGRPLELTEGQQTRDFVYATDAVEAFINAARSRLARQATINICSGTSTTVREVVEKILALTASPVTPNWGARPYREHEMFALSGDPTRASKLLGWRATTPLEEGLRETIAWFRAHRARFAAYQQAS